MEQGFYAEYREIEERHWWFRGRREIILRLLDGHVPPGDASRRVLDVGCGTGAMLQQLSRYGVVDGVDSDSGAVSFCRERGVERVQRLTSETLPWEAETFDLVTALDVIEHIDDDRAVLAEMRRVLRPGGTLLITVPAYQALWGPQDVISHHKRRYRARQVGERLAGAGLDLVKLSYFNTLLFPPIAAVRILRPDRPQRELKSDFTMTRPGPLNEVLARVFAGEAGLVERFNLPFGVSVVAIARRGSPDL